MPLPNGSLITFLKSGSPKENWLLVTENDDEMMVCAGEIGMILDFKKSKPECYKVLINDHVLVDVDEFMFKPLRQLPESTL